MLSQLVYANLTTQTPSEDNAPGSFTFADFTVGKQYPFSFRWLRNYAGSLAEVYPTIRAIRATIGAVDARPFSGSTKLQIGAGSSTGANTTAIINPGDTAEELKGKLNALSGLAPHDFTVESDSGSYIIRRASGEAFTVTARENKLKPVSFVRVRAWQDATGWLTEVRFIQSPLAFTDVGVPVLPPPPKIKTLEDGFTDPSGTYKRNEKQRLTIPPLFRGQYRIRQGDVVTSLLSLSDGPEEIKAALDIMLGPDGGVVTVQNVDERVADILFGGDLSGIDVAEMTVEVPTDSAPPGDWNILLELNTLEAWAALRALPEIKTRFTLEIDVPEDEEDEESASKTLPAWDEEITLKRALTLEGFATARPVNWLRKPNPKTYLPYSQTQIGVGALSYESAAFGDGAETHFEFDHNLNVLALTGLRVVNLSTGRVLKDSEFDAHVTNGGDSLELDMAAAPALNSLKVYLSTPQPIEFFVNDLAIEIAQVNLLQDILDDLTGRVVDLEAILPSTGPGAVATQATGIEILLPATKELLFFRGTAAEMKAAFTDKDGLDFTKTGRAGMLLPAVHDATVTSYEDGDLPALSAGQVWSNDSAAALEMGKGLAGGRVAVGGFFASDGRIRYAVTRAGETNSFFPTGFQRELWRIFINEKMLRINRTLDVQFGLALQLANATSNAQWLLVLERGTAPSQATPSTTSTNLENVAWESSPILSQRIIITGNRQTHSFGTRIKRSIVSSVDTLTLDTLLYGNWEGNNAAAPESANFALRARLIQFDTENSLAADARGTVAFEIIGAAGSEQPKAIIQ